MGSSDFYVDYNIEVCDVGDELKRQTEQRLGELASSYWDLIGAADDAYQKGNERVLIGLNQFRFIWPHLFAALKGFARSGNLPQTRDCRSMAK